MADLDIAARMALEEAKGTLNTATAPQVPSVPAVRTDDLSAVRKAVEVLRQIIELREGRSGSVIDKSLTMRDLLAEGAFHYNAAVSSLAVGVPSSMASMYVDPRPTLSVPPTLTNLVARGAFRTVILTWDMVSYANHAYVEVWRSATDALGAAVLNGTSTANIYTDASGVVGATYYYWVRAKNIEGAYGAYNAVPGVVAGLLRIGATDLGSLIVEAGNLAAGSVTATKVADAALTTAKFASGIEPVTIITSGALPTVLSTQTIFWTDKKLYRWNGTAYVATLPVADLVGQITAAQITANTITAGQIAAGAISATEIAAGAITTAKIFAGAVTATEIAAGAISATKLAANSIAVGTLAVQNGALVNAMIADATIDTAKVANLSADKINAGTLAAARIAAGSLGADKITAGTVTADRMTASLMQSDNVLTRGLTVRDASGNVILASGTPLTAANLGALVGGGNLLAVGAMAHAASGGLAGGWALYNGTTPTVGTSGGPINNGYFQRNSFTAGSSLNRGCVTSTAVAAIGGARGGIVVGSPYVLSWYMKSPDGYAGAGAVAANGTHTDVTITNPNCTASWQRYAFRVTFTSAIASGEIFCATTAVNQTASVDIANVQFEEGEVLTGYSETGYGPITDANISTYIAAAAIDIAQIKVASIGSLSALSAYLGSVTINAAGHLKGGQTDYATGTGFFLGYTGGLYKFSIGDTSQYMRWTGTALEIKLNVLTLSATTPAGGSYALSDTITRNLGTATVTASGGTSPYTYSWTYTWQRSDGYVPTVYDVGSASFSTNAATLYARANSNCNIGVAVTCVVTDANGLTATITKGGTGTFGTGPP